MAHDHHYVIHFVEHDATGVTPLCRDWSHATNWTTVASVASCPECVARLARLRAAPGPESQPAEPSP